MKKLLGLFLFLGLVAAPPAYAQFSLAEQQALKEMIAQWNANGQELGGGTAADVDFVPTTLITAVNVQAALEEVGFKIKIFAGDNPAPVDGDVWYNSITGVFRKRQNGSTTDLDSTGGTPGFADITGGTNVNALVIGTGGSLAVSGTGTIAATTATTATQLSINPSNCSAGQAAAGIDALGNAEGCFTAGGVAADAALITRIEDPNLTNEQALSTLATGLLKNTTGTGVLTIAVAGTDFVAPGGLAGTATALAADPTDCAAGSAATAIDAGGNLTCIDVGTQTELDAHANSTSAHSVTSSNTPNVGVQRDATGSFSAQNITAAGAFIGALTGTADLATALAGNPTDCAAGEYASAIDAGGNLTCSAVGYSQLSGVPATIVKTDQTNTFGAFAQIFTAASLRLPNNTARPANCTVGDIFFDTDATLGNNIYGCTSTDTWTLQGDGGGAGTGDIEDVWGCTSGNCNALIAAAGDSLNAASADSSIPHTVSASLPGTCTEGQMHQDTDSGGSELHVCTAANTWTKLTTAADILGTTGNIVVTGSTIDLGATAVQTDQANTYTTGAQSFAGATSLILPTAAGAAPTASASIAYDSTSNTLEVGVNGVNKTVAMIDGNVATATAFAAAPTNCPTNQFAHSIATDGDLTCSQVSAAQLTGAMSSSQVNTQDVVWAGVVSPPQITADQNNYAPTGLATASMLRLTSDASRTISGITAGVQGRILVLHNVGAQNIVLADESASSTAANRFQFPVSDITMLPDTVVFLQYDATGANPRWRSAGGTAGSITGSGTTNKLVKFTGSTAIGDSIISDDGTTIQIGTGNTGSIESGNFKVAGTASGTVTIQAGAAAAGTYNFNLPTAAGTAGHVLISGGGGSNAMSFGVASLSGGGTNQASWTASRCVQVNASGTALESAAAACGTGGGGSSAWADITGGTNTTAALVVGTGASLTYQGGTAASGEINATKVRGVEVGTLWMGKTVDPTSSDNTAALYLDGDMWVNSTANPDRIWLKTAESAGTAIWTNITGLTQTATDDTILVGSGTAWENKAIADCDGTSSMVRYDTTTNAFSCGTSVTIASGVSGLGTGIATALAVNTGSAGAPVLFNGAGGTPSSLTLTNATGLPTAGLADNAITSAKMAVVNTRRVCMLSIGNGTDAIVDADFSPFKQGRCYVPLAATIVEITAQGNAGTASFLLQRRRDAATLADLLSGALASAGTTEVCAMASTAQTCINGTTSSGSITLSNTSLNAGDWIEVKSGTGATTAGLDVAIVYTVN